jgi:ATP-binding cassette subfamily F protein uup
MILIWKRLICCKNWSRTTKVSHDRDFLDRTVTRSIGYEGDGHWQVYAGGYSDMVAQRGQGVSARRTLDSSASSKTKSNNSPKDNVSGAPATSTPKLSYKHKFRLEQLPKEIAAAEARIKSMTEKMGDPDYFSRDPDGFMATSEALAETQDKLDSLEMEWLELEEMQAGAG